MIYEVYIIFSAKLNRYYIGTCANFSLRLDEHNNLAYPNAFTTKGIPWIKFLLIDNLTSQQAYSIERHIKKMKSRKYIENLILHPEIIENLRLKYQ